MIIPPHLPPAAASPLKERIPTASAGKGSLAPQPSLSDARDPLIKDKPALQQLSNHNSDIGNLLTGLGTEPPVAAPELPAVASPLEDEGAAATSAFSATQTILSQPALAWAAQANVSPSNAQRILS